MVSVLRFIFFECELAREAAENRLKEGVNFEALAIVSIVSQSLFYSDLNLYGTNLYKTILRWTLS